ncbi:MAG: PepSY domain-containing protein [Hyphomicrobiaceae bacterium]|nr:PepSY domain-containing protein [Hyphomicrobiaceae bacterium]
MAGCKVRLGSHHWSGAVFGQSSRPRSFGDCDWAAKAIELGIQLHMGSQFGTLNQIDLAVPCLGLIMLIITGPYLRRQCRPSGSIGALRQLAPAQLAPAPMRTLALITMGHGMAFPLAGASLIVVGLLDLSLRLLRRGRRARPAA